jgi:2-oxoisovalerate dehydrogenase E1 component alpha subunit
VEGGDKVREAERPVAHIDRSQRQNRRDDEAGVAGSALGAAPATSGHRAHLDRPSEDGDLVARFEIRYRAYVDREGRALRPLPDFASDGSLMRSLYRAMLLTRTLDSRAVSLQRTGRLGTYPSALGQEAVAVGIASAMEAEDIFAGTYREQAVQIWRGVRLREILQVWGGDEDGNRWSGPAHDFPACVPIATHAPHTVGAALAVKLRREPRVVVCALGDGGTSKGDFYEAVNAAGVWHLPLVFVINNNEWAISVPRRLQSATATLAQKAIAGGLPAEQVDGNDVVSVRAAVTEAVERARSGGGPALIEALTYRLSDHTTADDASRYRSADEVSQRWKDDPLPRLRSYMAAQGWWTKSDEEALVAECQQEVDEALESYLALPPPPVTAMFDHLYEKLPEPLKAQRAAAVDSARPVSGGDDG